MILLAVCWGVPYVALFMFGVFLDERSLHRAVTEAAQVEFTQHMLETGNEAEIEKRRPVKATRLRSYILCTTGPVAGLYLAGQPAQVGETRFSGPQPWYFLGQFIPPWLEQGDEPLEHFWLSIIACLIVYVLEACPAFQRPFTTGFSQYLGKISFGMYLMHWPLRDSLYQQ